ncbi:DNA-binding transcriptional regulator, LysR family [Geodermatophilus obscurus]|uniref:DNA-binding transcriptional regulator, LysR family n=1 Tax=Geodermatophilus obscurus TaxID=1861 RepID=A0A1I5GN50_9ACTN|nr:LysR family transcriptional regulator [Geodermatophilus obscurus]SFO37415.1 DNA-binding transcriptional regulator, LysR family [Geodermatophilus obscurus]
MDVHLRELRALVAVAEEQSVTRAAQRLFLAQPALSRQLQALERRLGVPLLERLPRGVALTEAGRALLGPAREAVAAWERGLAAALATVPAGRLVVGMQTAVGRGLQRRALARFAELSPGTVPVLRQVDWRDPTAGLADGSSDVAFVWLPLPMDDADVLPVAREERVVALPSDHRLAGAPRVVLADLLDEPFIALPDSAGPLRDAWLAVADRGGRPPVVGAVADTPDAVFEAVASGLGVVLLAAGNADLYARPGIVCRPVEGLAPAVMALAWRRSDRRPVVAAFVRAVDGRS